jgi:hypothetical protein
MELKKEWPSFVLIIVMIVGVFYFGTESKPTEMGLVIVACAICLSFANIGKIQRFKGAGFEAEMKKAVEEAYATTDNLKSIAKPLILSTLDNLTFAGRWGGINEERKHKLKTDIDALVKSLSITDDEVVQAQNNFHFWHSIDHIEHLRAVMSKNKIQNQEVSEKVRVLFNPSLAKPPSVSDVSNALEGLTQEEMAILKPYVEDYEYYLENEKLRRPGALEN